MVNAHQRRKRRRALGVRPPYTCPWCSAQLSTWDAPCKCQPGEGRTIPPRIRKLVFDMTLYDLAGAAWERGWA